MRQIATGGITISDLKDGVLIGGFTLEQLIKKTEYYNKNDIDHLLDYRLDWRKTDAMFLEIDPDPVTKTIQFSLPLNSVDFKMRIFWDDINTSLFISEPYEAEKTIEYTYTTTTTKTIAIIGEVGLYITKGSLANITQFGTDVKLKSLGNALRHLELHSKTISTVTALDSFKSSDLEVLDGYTFANMNLANIPSNLSTWDVSNVTSFKNLLRNRTDWNINLSSFKTTHLNNASGLFTGLSVIPFNIDGWNFSNVLIGDQLFKGLNLSNVDLSKQLFTQMITADYMYQNCTNIINFHLQPVNNTSSITTAIGMFKGVVLTGKTISNTFTELVYADSMFEDSTLTNCTINLTLPNCISAKNIFKNAKLVNCNITLTFTKLETIDSGFSTANFDTLTRLNIDFGSNGKANASNMFASTNIKTENFNTITNSGNILYADYMFAYTTQNFSTAKFSLTGAISANGFIKDNILFNGDVTSLKFTNCVYLDSAFDGCVEFTGIGLAGLLCTSLSDIDYVFRNCSKLNNANAAKVLNNTLITMNYAFYGCSVVPLSASVNLPVVQYMNYAFYGCAASTLSVLNCTFNQVKSMISAFEGNLNFNSTVSKFNLSSLELNGFDRTFAGCVLFNKKFPQLIMPNLSKLNETFDGCSAYNQPIRINADMVDATNYLFKNCTSFNSTVELNLPKCDNATYIFYGCTIFNQSINKISLGSNSVNNISLEGLFYGCSVFNNPLDTLPFEKASILTKLLYNCTSFNQDVGSLNIKVVTEMNRTFYNCGLISAANWSNATNWIMNNCTTLECAFYACTNFNPVINNWIVSNLTSLYQTFMLCTTFNQSLALWNVSSVRNMSYAFYSCTNLKSKDFSSWSITLAKTLGNTTATFTSIGSGNTLPAAY